MARLQRHVPSDNLRHTPFSTTSTSSKPCHATGGQQTSQTFARLCADRELLTRKGLGRQLLHACGAMCMTLRAWMPNLLACSSMYRTGSARGNSMRGTCKCTSRTSRLQLSGARAEAHISAARPLWSDAWGLLWQHAASSLNHEGATRDGQRAASHLVTQLSGPIL